jgi:hypothetical protein
MPKTIMEWIIAVFGAGGVSKFGWDVFMARSQNRKGKTDNTVNLVNSSIGYADSLTRRIDSINTRFDDFRKVQEQRDQERERRDRQQARLLVEHSKWDHRVTIALRDLGRPVEEAPPLFIIEGNDT